MGWQNWLRHRCEPDSLAAEKDGGSLLPTSNSGLGKAEINHSLLASRSLVLLCAPCISDGLMPGLSTVTAARHVKFKRAPQARQHCVAKGGVLLEIER